MCDVPTLATRRGDGAFIVAIAGANSNRATISGVAFTFSVKGLQAGQSPIQCTARVSKGDNLPIDVPSIGADLTVLGVEATPTPFVPATATPPLESPTPAPLLNGSLSGQVLASKPVTVRLLDINNVEITSVFANPDGTFLMAPLPGDYILDATASGFLSRQGSVTIIAGNSTVKPAVHLLAGDVDGNQVIHQFDALTIGINYTASAPGAANLNNDAVIDFLDRVVDIPVPSEGTWTPEEPACAVADFRAGLDAMRDRHPGLALWSVGYSFGAWVATVASDGDAGVTAVVAIAPPVDSYDFSLLARSSAVKLIVHAEFDEFAPGRAVQRFYATLLEPRELVVIDGAVHAFDGHALDVGDAIEELLGDFGDRVA